MRKPLLARGLAALTVAFMIATNVFDAIFAFALHPVMPWVRVLAFIGFGVNLVAIAAIVFLSTFYFAKITRMPPALSIRLLWICVVICGAIYTVSVPLSAITLIAMVRHLPQLPRLLLDHSTEAMLVAWFALWGVSVLLGTAFFGFTIWWTKATTKSQKLDHESMDLDFGIGPPDMVEARPETHDTTRSFPSQDNTLASPPRTPTTLFYKSSFNSSSSPKMGPGESRTKLISSSNKSSFDLATGPSTSTDDGFDRWDTSAVHRDIRATLQTSPPVTRGGLETIPGSRPESPANALDGPFLPSSPHATTSDTATAVDLVPSSSRKASLSSSPSSPPNFSRPTSKQHDQAGIGSSLEDLVHPLFRPTSPEPAPMATPGTRITASPLAGQPITPRTLSRMRSGSLPTAQNTRPHMPGSFPTDSSINPTQDGRHSKNPSFSGSTTSPGPGSPGPSIIEEEDLPPILPGFVLSAGQRSSFVGYGKRKSVKERPKSAHSQFSRLSVSMT